MAGSEIKRNQSVERVFDIIEIMAREGEPMRLNDLAEKLEMSATTVYRFLKTLMDRNYVKQDEDSLKYFLTLRLNYFADMIHSNYNIRMIVSPYLTKLAETTGESASLVIMEDNMAVYIDKCEGSNRMIKSFQRIGYRAPLYCTGVGKVFLSELTSKQRDEISDISGPYEKLTLNTITEKEDLDKELLLIKNKGVSYDNEECEIGAKCVAVPIRDYSKRVIAAISVSGPTSRMTDEAIREIEMQLLKVSKAISTILGYIE